MTTPHDSDKPGVTEGDQVGQLLKLAGRRQMPDPSDMRRAREAARDEWTLVVRQRAWRGRWRTSFGALAAAVCAIAAAVWLRPGAPASAVDVATLQRIAGTVVVSSDDLGRQKPGETGMRIRRGTRIEVADDGGASFVLNDGAAVRLDRATVAVVADADRVTLERGAAYVDSGRSPTSAASLRIMTSFGAVQHVGTRFEVRLVEASMRIRVRDGLVAVERDGTRWTTGAGEALVVRRTGTPTRQHIVTSGPEWSWADRLSSPFVLEGATVPAFLDWVGREAGWEWEIADPALRARANRIVLHGSIDRLTPEEALGTVLPASGLTYRRDGARLLIAASRQRR